MAQDCLTHLNEEAVFTDAYTMETSRVDDALRDLESEFSPSFIDQEVLKEAMDKVSVRVARREAEYTHTVRIHHSPCMRGVSVVHMM